MGLSMKFADMIYECISTNTFSFLLNGGPMCYFSSDGVLGQRDPLSLLLFTNFTILLDMEIYEGNITPIFLIEPSLTHLLNADDIAVFAKASARNAKSVNKIMHIIKKSMGLEMNEHKANLFF